MRSSPGHISRGSWGISKKACRELRELCREYSAFGDRAEAMYCWGISAVKAGNNQEAEEVLGSTPEAVSGE